MDSVMVSMAGPSCAVCQRCGRWGEAVSGVYPRVPKGWTRELVVVVSSWSETRPDPVGRPIPVEPDSWVSIRQAVGWTTSQVAWVPAIRCPGAPVTAAQGRACRAFLLAALRVLRPATIWLSGKLAWCQYLDRWAGVRGEKLAWTDLSSVVRIPEWQDESHPSVWVCPDPVAHPGERDHVIRLLRGSRHPMVTIPAMDSMRSCPPRIAVDTEFDATRCYTLAVSDGQTIAVTDQEAPNPVVRQALHQAEFLIGHHVWVDLDQLIREGLCRESWARGEQVSDTLLLAKMTDETLDPGSYGVEALIRRYARVEAWKAETEALDVTQPGTWTAMQRVNRCGRDAWASYRLWEVFHQTAKGPVTFTHRLAAVLHRIRLAGVAIASQDVAQMVAQVTAARDQTHARVLQLAAACGVSSFSPTNDAQIRTIVYDKLGLTPTHMTPTGKPAVSKEALAPYRSVPFVEALFAFNEADRTLAVLMGEKGVTAHLTPYREGLQILPVNIWALEAKTARRSSTRPNMQNWTRAMRTLVRSRWEGGAILDVDYRSLEPRVLGVVAQDARYLDYFVSGAGYVGIAQDLLGRTVEKGTVEYRTVKEVVLGTNYGAGPRTIGKKLWYELEVRLARTYAQHERAVRAMQDRYLTVFSGIAAYRARQERLLLRTGQITTATGRVRHLPCPDGRETPGFGHLLNQAYNFPIQSLASDITGSALVAVEDAICERVGLSRVALHQALLTREYPMIPLIVNEIHDELVFDLPPDGPVSQAEWTTLIVETMRACPVFRTICPLDIPLDVEYVVGPTWGLKA